MCEYWSSDSLNCLNHYWFCGKTSLHYDWLFSHEFKDAIRLRAVLCSSSWRWKEIIIIYLPLMWQENCYDEKMKSQHSSNIIASFSSSRDIFPNEDHICMRWLQVVCVSCSGLFLRFFSSVILENRELLYFFLEKYNKHASVMWFKIMK